MHSVVVRMFSNRIFHDIHTVFVVFVVNIPAITYISIPFDHESDIPQDSKMLECSNSSVQS